MREIKDSVLSIIKHTDQEYLDELNKNLFNIFYQCFSHLKNKKILFFNDEIYSQNNYILNFLLENNDVFYYVSKKNIFFNNRTGKLFNIYELRKNNFDYIISNCVAFDKNKNFILDKAISKNIKRIKYDNLLFYALTIQMFDLTKFIKHNIKNAKIISNNFIVK